MYKQDREIGCGEKERENNEHQATIISSYKEKNYAFITSLYISIYK